MENNQKWVELSRVKSIQVGTSGKEALEFLLSAYLEAVWPFSSVTNNHPDAQFELQLDVFTMSTWNRSNTLKSYFC